MVDQLWERPQVYSIQVILPENPLQNLNYYVIKTPRQNIVIDTGFNRPECRKALWTGLEELGLDYGRTILFITHLHSDHTGLVWDFVCKGMQMYMSRIVHDIAFPYCAPSEESAPPLGSPRI